MLETNVHFPRDLNLLWDACCTCLGVLPHFARLHDLPGWRKAAIWRTKLKTLLRVFVMIHHGGGTKKLERLAAAANAYLQKTYALEQKVFASLGELRAQPLSLVGQSLLVEVESYFERLIKPLDLIERWVLKGEAIPMPKKTFRSLSRIPNGSARAKCRPLWNWGTRSLSPQINRAWFWNIR